MSENAKVISNDTMIRKIFATVDEMKDEILEGFVGMLRIPALSPINKGEGEGKKAEYLMKLLEGTGMHEIKVYDAPDSVPRPNIIAIKHGKQRNRRLWVMTHMDVVPPGELTLWETDPFEPVIKNGKVFARGSEDNGQELIASLYALKVLNKLDLTPAMDIGLAFVADEETGSKKGIRFLMDKDIFRKNDLIIVPDAGNPDGTELEIAEKSILWLRITTRGEQCHASTPEHGINAFAAGMKFGVLAMEELKVKFNAEDMIFRPSTSTFEPTKKEANVPNVNTIPGKDVFYMDCRILPEYHVNDVIEYVRDLAVRVEHETTTRIEIEPVQIEMAAPPTPENARVVQLLGNAVRRVYDTEPEPVGIGGGTCAAMIRRAGFNAVVWGRIDDMAHSPNEYAKIENLMGDTKVYALLYAGL